jgi:thiol-disulfide isomerase/thioredoxin
MIKKAIKPLLLAGIIVFLALKIRNHFFIPELPIGKTSLISENGEKLDIEQMEEPYLLISCVQSWCGDCIRETPSIQALQEKTGKEKLAVVMMSDEEWGKIRRFSELSKTSLTVWQSEKSLADLGVRVFPTTWLLGPDRKILLAKLEGFDWNSAEVHRLLK